MSSLDRQTKEKGIPGITSDSLAVLAGVEGVQGVGLGRYKMQEPSWGQMVVILIHQTEHLELSRCP